MRDIFVGRRLTVVSRFVNVGTTSTLLCSGNPRRVALVISSPVANRLTLCPDLEAIDLQGIVLHAATPPFKITLGEYGQSLTKPMSAIMTVAAANIGVWEVLADFDIEELPNA